MKSINYILSKAKPKWHIMSPYSLYRLYNNMHLPYPADTGIYFFNKEKKDNLYWEIYKS